MGRFINADDACYLGADGTPLSYNLFAYCGNNPVMGYDPTGHWDWGGVIAGLGIIAVTVAMVSTCGIATIPGALVASAAVATGAITTCAAATDSTMVVDLSYSYQKNTYGYGKVGASVVIDFAEDESNLYLHGGGGIGYSSGASYSVGIVSNYQNPQDYAGPFADVATGLNVGIDHCWTPQDGLFHSTQATSITFGMGLSYGVGLDYFTNPIRLSGW